MNLYVTLQLLQIIGFGIFLICLKKFLPSYLKKKGENLATKEDVAEITEKVESVRTQYNTQLERLKAELERQKLLYLKNLELETVKLNRVLPILEELNLQFAQHRMMYANYLASILNKGGIPDNFEKKRVKIDDVVIEKLHRIGIYLPDEFRNLLNRLRRLVSVSFQEPTKLRQAILETKKYPINDVVERASRLYDESLECFYALSQHFCYLTEPSTTYTGILNNYGLSPAGNSVSTDSLTEFVEVVILFPEYYGVEVLSKLIPVGMESERRLFNRHFQLYGVINGACPIQGFGTIAGKKFYFRARGQEWTFAIANKNELDPVRILDETQGFFKKGRDGDSEYDAGCMPFDDAEQIIKQCATEYLDKFGEHHN